MDNLFKMPLKVVFIVGACRSGKTSIGQLVATSENTEFVDEPLLLVSLPILSKIGKIERKEAISLFRLYLEELVFDIILMRRSNFRPYDNSTVWKNTNTAEMLKRISLKRRVDAYNYVCDNKGFTVVISLPDNIENFNFIKEAHPDSKIIEVMRDGVNVAELIREKKWFSDSNLISPFNATITRKFINKNNTYQLPWWIESGDESLFLSLSEYERCLYYWCQINKIAHPSQELPDKIFVKFEELIDETSKVRRSMFNFLGAEETNFTSMIESEISEFKEISSVDDYNGKTKELLRIKYTEIMRKNYG